MALILDNLIVFLFRWIRIGVEVLRSRRWDTAIAKVEDACAKDDMYPFAVISYEYVLDGVTYSGKYLKAFWYDDTATQFAASYPAGRETVVRYCPNNPSKSFLRESDHSRHIIPLAR